ncbi:integral membrane protein [Staphylococcus gallinarum]|uniref:Integral membrane protein n=1 Tax=Staphylococcus gallinarum TaxID=1293 RepID=A0A380FNU3_STAGA|nr:integral membrane protein [Staphylococcus gallinarum]
MTIIFTFICSFCASYFFNVIYDAPKKLFIPAGFAGAMGYMVYFCINGKLSYG